MKNETITNKTIKLSFAVILSFILISQTQRSQAQDKCFPDDRCYSCDPDQCQLPDCWCPSPSTPGGLPLDEVPQFVILSFDDAITKTEYPRAMDIIERTQNPSGCSGKATFFVSTEYTDFWLAQRAYAQGHEIAVHTMSHTTGKSTSKETFEKEILGARRALSLYSKIAESNIKGFRAPFLGMNSDGFEILKQNGFKYDSSLPEQVKQGFSSSLEEQIWPYTMDHGIGQRCESSECSGKYKGLWELPMWVLHDTETGNAVASMDPQNPQFDNYELYKANFDKKHKGNKSPFGIFLHTAWLHRSDNAEKLAKFMEYASQYDDVWFVTVSQLLQWMEDPMPLSKVRRHVDFGLCEPRYSREDQEKEVCDGLDNTGDGKVDGGLTQLCQYDGGKMNFKTCAAECPSEYPWLDSVDYKSSPPPECNGQVVEEDEACEETSESDEFFSLSSSSTSNSGATNSSDLSDGENDEDADGNGVKSNAVDMSLLLVSVLLVVVILV
eukprot:gb/GECH01014393.1/.p1 GENE.gb/GECH01014393.1/~~gb/GECH01014393.1/.p1  ORF type:complete len:496 (+),score=106.61 gb/GECH01014393.1/:1-1488(+)